MRWFNPKQPSIRQLLACTPGYTEECAGDHRELQGRVARVWEVAGENLRAYSRNSWASTADGYSGCF
jgi:hypothetical protein